MIEVLIIIKICLMCLITWKMILNIIEYDYDLLCGLIEIFFMSRVGGCRLKKS
jgi:hypothetical protein